MFKKLLIIICCLFFLAACGKKESGPVVPEGYKGPTSGPDPAKMQPTYGPNDPVPDSESNS